MSAAWRKVESTKLKADDHMNHHCVGIACRHGEALDSTQERLLISGI